MTKNQSAILEKVNKIERELQSLKFDLMPPSKLPKTKKQMGIYGEKEILREIRKIRKKLWDEKYSKT